MNVYVVMEQYDKRQYDGLFWPDESYGKLIGICDTVVSAKELIVDRKKELLDNYRRIYSEDVSCRGEKAIENPESYLAFCRERKYDILTGEEEFYARYHWEIKSFTVRKKKVKKKEP